MSIFKITVLVFGIIALASCSPTSRTEEEKQKVWDPISYPQSDDINNEKLALLAQRLREILGRASRVEGSTFDSDFTAPMQKPQNPELPMSAGSLSPYQLDLNAFETESGFEKRADRFYGYRPMRG
ncbi:hypothetical protein FO519_004123 [Halicephalobus sp. NKZ332]|nr:hypothetical protein FO519_004123 [Halicephalobus sp. NKZ332]